MSTIQSITSFGLGKHVIAEKITLTTIYPSSSTTLSSLIISSKIKIIYPCLSKNLPYIFKASCLLINPSLSI